MKANKPIFKWLTQSPGHVYYLLCLITDNCIFFTRHLIDFVLLLFTGGENKCKMFLFILFDLKSFQFHILNQLGKYFSYLDISLYNSLFFLYILSSLNTFHQDLKNFLRNNFNYIFSNEAQFSNFGCFFQGHEGDEPQWLGAWPQNPWFLVLPHFAWL